MFLQGTFFLHTDKFIDKEKGRKVGMRDIPTFYIISTSEE